MNSMDNENEQRENLKVQIECARNLIGDAKWDSVGPDITKKLLAHQDKQLEQKLETLSEASINLRVQLAVIKKNVKDDPVWKKFAEDTAIKLYEQKANVNSEIISLRKSNDENIAPGSINKPKSPGK